MSNTARTNLAQGTPLKLVKTLETRRVAQILLAAAVIVTSGQLQASPFEFYGAGARASAMSGALGAVAHDIEAIYYNPALLMNSTRSHFGVELHLVSPQLHIDRTKDSPTDNQGGRDNIIPDPSTGVTLGTAVPFSVLGQKLSLGLMGFIPTFNPTRLEAIDPATPHFTLHQSNTDKFFLGAGVAIELVPGLRFGVGAQVLATLSGNAQATLDAAQRKILRRTFETTISTDVAPIIGIAYTGQRWSLGATFRGALALDYRLPIAFILKDGGRLDFLIEGTALYTPDQLNLAAAWHDADWTIALDLTLAKWSDSPTPAATVATSIDDSNLYPDSETVTTLIAMDTIDVGTGYADIIVPRLGIERHLTPSWTLRGGYCFRPTPLPRQVGYSNTIDNSAHQLAVGVNFRFDPLFNLRETPIELRAVVQTSLLVPRHMDKDPNRDILGIGSYDSGGQIWHIGFAYHRDF